MNIINLPFRVYCTLTVVVVFSLITVILSWLVDKKVAEQALKRDILIEEDDVECRPEKVSAAIADENVDVHLVRKYFTADAWLVLQDVLHQKKTENDLDVQCLLP